MVPGGDDRRGRAGSRCPVGAEAVVHQALGARGVGRGVGGAGRAAAGRGLGAEAPVDGALGEGTPEPRPRGAGAGVAAAGLAGADGTAAAAGSEGDCGVGPGELAEGAVTRSGTDTSDAGAATDAGAASGAGVTAVSGTTSGAGDSASPPSPAPRAGADSRARRASALASAFRLVGPMTMIMLRPSCLGADSTKPSSTTSSANRCNKRKPNSGRDCSRPRNMIVTLTLSPALRKRSTWPFLVP